MAISQRIKDIAIPIIIMFAIGCVAVLVEQVIGIIDSNNQAKLCAEYGYGENCQKEKNNG